MRILIPVFFLTAYQAFSQSFQQVPIAGLPKIQTGAYEWADYDKDGDYDVILAGDSGNWQYYTEIYTNSGNGNFALLKNTGLPGVRNSDVAWADYDNDGDLDLALSGISSNGIISKLFENNGTNQFSENKKVVLEPCFNSNLVWGDYNNDGLVDLVVTGDYNMTGVAAIYTNSGKGNFSRLNVNLKGITQASVDWEDINNDGFLDLFTSGYAGNMGSSAPATYIYLNDKAGNFFEYTSHGLFPSSNGSSSWGDYDSDGDPDLILTGGQPFRTKLYKNNLTSFTEISVPFPQVGGFSSGYWGDFDYDGDLDVMVSGRTDEVAAIYYSGVYANNGNDSFTEIKTNFPLMNSKSNWIDIDHDNDLDICLFEISNSASLVILRNDLPGVKLAPGIPSSLSAVQKGNQISFSWFSPTVQSGPVSALNYNLRVGSTPGGNDIVNSYSNNISGFHYLNQKGNAGWKSSYTLNNTPHLKLYWSVQAINNAMVPSLFAQEQVINLVITSLLSEEKEEKQPAIVFNGPKEAMSFTYSSTSSGSIEIQITAMDGKVFSQQQKVKNGDRFTTTMDLSSCASGIYIIEVTENQSKANQKFFLN